MICFTDIFAPLLLMTVASLGDAATGKLIFAALFAVLIIWLYFIPAKRIGQEHHRPPWWKNVRVWAIVIATIQMFVYLFSGT